MEKSLKIVDSHTVALTQLIHMHIRDFETNLEGVEIKELFYRVE